MWLDSVRSAEQERANMETRHKEDHHPVFDKKKKKNQTTVSLVAVFAVTQSSQTAAGTSNYLSTDLRPFPPTPSGRVAENLSHISEILGEA